MARYLKRRTEEFHESLPGTIETPVYGRQSVVVAYNPVERLIDAIVVVVESLLVLRLVFRLLGSSSANGIVAFVYNVSLPLVRPFFGIVNTNLGLASFEWATILAMLVYAIVGYVVIALLRTVTGPE